MFGFVKESEFNDLLKEKEQLLKDKAALQFELTVERHLVNEQRKMIKDLVEVIEMLKQKPPMIHNERNAGRKPKATTEQINQVMELHNAGLSLSQILIELNMPWHKGTIKNIIEREKLKLQQQQK
jgi:hypothetical protein